MECSCPVYRHPAFVTLFIIASRACPNPTVYYHRSLYFARSSRMDGSLLANQPLVIDNGSLNIRSGIAGGSQPSTTIKSCVGRPKHDRVMIGGLEGSAFVGQQVSEHRGLMKLNWPMKNGSIENWDDMELIWQHMYNEMSLKSEDHPILITEPPLASRRQRLRSAEVFFETFNVPAAYFAIPAVLSLYASGKTSGLCIDVGDGLAHCVPIYEGFAISSAIMRSDIGGSEVTNFLQLLLRKQNIKLMTSTEKETVRDIKEKHCYIAANATAGETDRVLNSDINEANTRREYRLPDGQKISLEARELVRAPELLFKPHIWGSEEKSVQQLVADAVARSDLDLRATLFQSIVISGGTSQCRGFGDRLLSELKEIAPASTKLRIFAPANRSETTWIGGSILAGLSSFRKMWISASEYEEKAERLFT